MVALALLGGLAVKNRLFAKLLASVRQMNQIVRGDAEPSREFVVQTIRTRKINDDDEYDAAVRVLNCFLDQGPAEGSLLEPFIIAIGKLIGQYERAHPETQYELSRTRFIVHAVMGPK